MLYYIDEQEHKIYKTTAEQISDIVYSDDFIKLYFELETIYRKLNFDNPPKRAFEDALYSFFAQEEKPLPIKAL